jgi:thioredoxin reductase (NADPH)
VALEEIKEDSMEFTLTGLGQKGGKEETYDVVIIGGGPAGLTAGIYAGRGGLKTVIVEKGLPGGQIAQTEEVENYPGFPEGISGPELAGRMAKQAEKFGARIVMDEVQGLEKTEEGFLVRGFERNYPARVVIIATGANPRKLQVPGEEKFYGRGVSTCATCDAFFYRDKEVVVVGGGDAAVEEGLFLTKFARKVTLVHRRTSFGPTRWPRPGPSRTPRCTSSSPTWSRRSWGRSR